MAREHVGAVIRRIERLFAVGSVAGLTEGQLLDRFLKGGDEGAFEALLARHGPMVLGVCRQWLRDPNDVETGQAHDTSNGRWCGSHGTGYDWHRGAA